MGDENRAALWRRLRRASQAVCLGLFLVLLRGSFSEGWPARLFLQFDPFIAVSNALATRALYWRLLWSLVILVPALLLGRFFCGWICPLGTLHHLASSIRRERKSGRRRIESNRYRPWQGFKYYMLVALTAAALCGSAVAGLFDPIALAVRSFGLALLPAWNYALGALAGQGRLRGLAFGLLLDFKQFYFRQGFLLAVILLALLALDLRITRFWCRALCPLGALLGVVSRWSVVGLEKRTADCGDCRRCLLDCQGGDDPIPGVPWRKAECHLCLNCAADCPRGALRFRFFAPLRAAQERPDLKRRTVLVSLAGGAAAVPLLRANTGLTAEPDPRLIRPPGALDEKEFLARCIRCGACIKVCPNNALQPAVSEAGWEGLWTPVLVARVGYCEPACTLCGDACPSGAIWEFTAREKAWVGAAADSRPMRIGTAFYDRGRCLPWAMGTECIVCEEWCPTSPKAIYLRPAEVADAVGGVRQVRQPYLDAERCVGCGACEYACPVRGRPAIAVTSVGESRSTTNQILLRRTAPQGEWLPDTGAAGGWTKTGEARSFEAADLWKYVDGDAERYVRAGVRRTMTANYRFVDGLEATADVHLMASPGAAAAMFESEPSAGSHPVALGDAGRSYGQSITFRRGSFFVRLVAYQESGEAEAALMPLGRAIEAGLMAGR